MVAAWWPIAGWIPLGVENVTPGLTKSLGLKRQLSRPADPLPQLSIGAFMRWGNPWVLLQQAHIFKQRFAPGTSTRSCQDMSPAFRFTCVHPGLLLLYLARRVEGPGFPSTQQSILTLLS